MALVYDKGTYYAQYSWSPRCQETCRRYSEIRLHYHPELKRYKRLDVMAGKLNNKLSLTASDRVVVVGAAFGWLCDQLKADYGCICIGTDISPYIHDVKDLSPDDELQEAVEAAGLSITEGIGLEVWDKFKDPNPRATSTILNEDLSTEVSRQAVTEALSGTPTHIITEEMWQILDGSEQADLQSYFEALGGQVTHIVDFVVI